MNEPLDVFGQNPRLSGLYTQLCFAFALDNSDDACQNLIVEHLEGGLAELAQDVPWVSGQVARDENGQARIVPLDDLPQVIVKDLSDELPSLDSYRRAHFPFSWLDEDIIAPCKTLPDETDAPSPVFLLQINFVAGGVLLVVNGQHNCMDIRGQSQIIDMLSKSCRGEPIATRDLAVVNGPRQSIIPLLTGEEDTAGNAEPAKSQPIDDGEGEAIWAYFDFVSADLQRLKALALEDITSEFVSTDDVLSAFIWQSFTRARSYRLDVGSTQSTFERQVDARGHLNIPRSYTGNVVCKTAVSMSISEILDSPCGAVASRLRRAIGSEADIGHQTRKAATLLHESLMKPKPSKPTVVSRPKVSSTDIKMSSWAKEDCYDYDFGGLLGKPVAVRRPNFPGWEGLAYTMPKSRDGEIAVALCLRREDLEALKRDHLFCQYCELVS